MRKILAIISTILIGGAMSVQADGYFNFSYSGNLFTTGVTIFSPIPGPPIYAGSEYSVQLYGASGFNAASNSLSAISGAKIDFFGTTGSGPAHGPDTDGAGLWFVSPVLDTGLGLGSATLQAKAWFNNGGSVTSYEAALLGGHGTGQSILLNATLVENINPNFQDFDSLNMPAFVIGIPEPGTFALVGLGVVALFVARRRRS